MNIGDRKPDETGAALARGVTVIVVLGIALGVMFNFQRLASGPKRGLAWIRQDAKLASLEATPGVSLGVSRSTDPSAAGAAAPATTTPATRPPSAGAPAAGKPATTPATATPATTPEPPTTPPQVTAAPAVPDTREPLEAGYETVRKLWDAGAAVFVDARSAEEYAGEHIAGAVHLAFDDVFKDPDRAKRLATRGRAVVIAYCGGDDCDLSRNLAFSLIEAGHRKVLVLRGGLPDWKQGGGPVVTGAAPGSAP
jgi:rhodanese-related sulfurtransferase